MRVKLPESIKNRVEYKRKYNLCELYVAFVYLPRALVKLASNKRSKLVDKQFTERLMLAVTEVNGCAACSYAHTLMALRQGMSNEEINSFLEGDSKFTKPEEAKAIYFAQHYANSRGIPAKEAYEVVVNEYGSVKASIFLSAVQVMMAANMYGIPYSAFISRLHGKPYQDSTLLFELWIQIVGVLILPITFFHALFLWIIGKQNFKFA